MVMIMSQAPTALRETVIKEIEGICGFFYVSYTGTVAQWNAFLHEPVALPATLSNLKIQLDYSRGLAIKSSRFEMLVPPAVLKINADSVLMLKYTYMRDGANTVWDLGGVYLADSDQKLKWVGILRRSKPSPSMPEETARAWQSMSTGGHPWEGVAFVTGGRTEINAMANMKDLAAGKTNVGYTMSLNSEGIQPANKMKSEFSVLQRGFTKTE